MKSLRLFRCLKQVRCEFLECSLELRVEVAAVQGFDVPQHGDGQTPGTLKLGAV